MAHRYRPTPPAPLGPCHRPSLGFRGPWPLSRRSRSGCTRPKGCGNRNGSGTPQPAPPRTVRCDSRRKEATPRLLQFESVSRRHHGFLPDLASHPREATEAPDALGRLRRCTRATRRSSARMRVLDVASTPMMRGQADPRPLTGGPNGLRWSSIGQPARSFRFPWPLWLANWRSLAYRVVLVSAAESQQDLRWRIGFQPPTLIYRRPNIGYDFGSWAAGLDALPAIARAPYVLFVNDSMLGPFSPDDEIVKDFEALHHRRLGVG